MEYDSKAPDPNEAQELERLRKAWRDGIDSGDAGELDWPALKQEARARLTIPIVLVTALVFTADRRSVNADTSPAATPDSNPNPQPHLPFKCRDNGYYPARACALGVEGSAKISCDVVAEDNQPGHLENCTITDETPSGYGFGEATLRLSKTWKLKPRPHVDPNSRFSTVVKWNLK